MRELPARWGITDYPGDDTGGSAGVKLSSSVAFAHRASSTSTLHGHRLELDWSMVAYLDGSVELPVHDPAVEFELPATLLGMHPAQREPGVWLVLGADVGDIGAVAAHIDGGLQARHGQAPIEQRLRTHHIHHRHAEPGKRQHQHRPHQPFEPLHGVCPLSRCPVPAPGVAARSMPARACAGWLH